MKYYIIRETENDEGINFYRKVIAKQNGYETMENAKKKLNEYIDMLEWNGLLKIIHDDKIECFFGTEHFFLYIVKTDKTWKEINMFYKPAEKMLQF
jgi:hypothetical protein